ncbi:MAG: multiubiquitin domain-containing protein, partial [Myxococcota bacterium]|nr:multiubiquitin domain-containing protein [Myxococcota bacterium]
EMDLDLLIALLSAARIDIDIDIAIDVDIWPTERVDCARRWRFLLDNKRYISERAVLTGEDILAFGDLSSSTHQLFEIVRGARRPVAPNEEVSLKRPGIERFIAIKHAVTDGDGGEQAHLSWLTEEDREELERRGLDHACLMDGKSRWLIFEDYPIPEGYDHERVDLALLIPPGYPAAPLDMAYVFPALQRVDNKAIRAISNQRIGDRTFQRWSRHRDKKGPAWDPEVDGIKTHLLAVDAWMANEVKR